MSRFHGDPARFQAVATFVAEEFGRDVRYVADVAGGQASSRASCASATATRPRSSTRVLIGCGVVEAAIVRPIVIVPSCNFWDRGQKLGRDALLDAIERWLEDRGVASRREQLAFAGPMNVAIVTSQRA